MEAVLSPLRRVGMLLDHGKVCASLGTEDLPGTSDSDSAALLRQLQGWSRSSSDLIFLEDTSREEAQRLLVDHAEAERAFTLLLTVLDESADESLRLRCSVAVVDIWKRRPFTREVCENRYHAAPFPDLPRLLRTAERVGEAAPALRNFLSLLYYRRHWIDRTVRRWAGLDPGLFEVMGKDLTRERAVDHGLFRRFALALAMAEAPADFVNRELPGLSAAGFSDASRWLKEWAEMEDVQEPTRGRDLLGAFVQWGRQHSSNQIFISERVVKEDIYTSIHIAEFDVAARDTKLGPEEITRDIPDVGEEALKNLDHDGIVRIGAEVMPGDILVGKITPKSEAELAPEERLLRAIFGEEAAEVKDTSLRVPSGCIGIVQDIQISSHSNVRKRAEKVEPMELEEKADKVTEDLTEKLSDILLGEKIPLDVVDAQTGEIIIPANREITKTLLRKLASAHDHIEIDPSPIRDKILETISSFEGRFQELDSECECERELDRPEAGDDVGPVVTEVKVFIAAKHKLSVGDKMAGRYGKEGVVATIVPEEDMPYLADGTPVDIVLHPLGVPSRMNVGQVLEKDISIGGKSLLFDGRTGDAFHQPVVVRVISMLKLGHLVADKIPARAVGSYSLATQQPLGGKAPYGGQRFGEMEVGALEAYGAAYTLQELLTVKSDDVQGRTRIYEAIVKGDNNLGAGTPESFNVLIKEMQSLGLDVCPGKHGSERGAAPSSEDAAQYDSNYSS